MSTTPTTPARRRPTTWLAVGLFGLAVGMMATVIWLGDASSPGDSSLSREDPGVLQTTAMAIVVLSVFLSLPSVGMTLAIQRPRSPIGWLLLAGAVALIAGSFVAAYVEHSFTVSPLPGYRWLDWLGSDPLQFLALTLLLFWVPLVFPDGRLRNHR